jgi:hypothetical protein
MADAFTSTVGEQYSDATKEADAAISRVDRVTDTMARPTPGQPTDDELEDELDIVLREPEEPVAPFAEPSRTSTWKHRKNTSCDCSFVPGVYIFKYY